jgi:hypothetical protein
METIKIADLTVKEIFSMNLGEDNAAKVLEVIQKNYNAGKRGQELKEITEIELKNIHSLKDLDLRVIPFQIILPPFF